MFKTISSIKYCCFFTTRLNIKPVLLELIFLGPEKVFDDSSHASSQRWPQTLFFFQIGKMYQPGPYICLLKKIIAIWGRSGTFIYRLNKNSISLCMSPVSTVFHTVVIMSIVLKSAVRMVAFIPQFKMSML